MSSKFRSKACLGVFVLMHLALMSNAQEASVYELFEQVYGQAGAPTKKEFFSGQVLKGKRNGMGVLLHPRKWLYAGDFSNGGFSGTGMYVTEGGIPHCEGSFIYVGRWKEGKKSGKGRCYAENGDLVYEGKFEADKPVDKYPSVSLDTKRFFSISSIDDKTFFVGEYAGIKPDGFGAILFSNGDTILGQFQEGKRKGICLFTTVSSEWQTQNYKDGDVQVLSSSENYAAIDRDRKTMVKQYLQGVGDEFFDWVVEGVELAGNIATTISEMHAPQGGYEEDGETVSSSGGGSSSAKGTKGSSGSEVSAKNKDSNSYSSYESQLIKMNTYHESEYNDSDRRQIQQKMRDIRTKWEGRGYKMFHSTWEDWDGSKR